MMMVVLKSFAEDEECDGEVVLRLITCIEVPIAIPVRKAVYEPALYGMAHHSCPISDAQKRGVEVAAQNDGYTEVCEVGKEPQALPVQKVHFEIEVAGEAHVFLTVCAKARQGFFIALHLAQDHAKHAEANRRVRVLRAI